MNAWSWILLPTRTFVTAVVWSMNGNAVGALVRVEGVGLDRVVPVAVDVDLFGAVRDLEAAGAGLPAAVDVVEVHAHLGDVPALGVGVGVASRHPRHLLVAPGAPRVPGAGGGAVGTGHAHRLAEGVALRAHGREQLAAAPAPPQREVGVRRSGARRVAEALSRGEIARGTGGIALGRALEGTAGVALRLVAPVHGVHHLVDRVVRVGVGVRILPGGGGAAPDGRDAHPGRDTRLGTR